MNSAGLRLSTPLYEGLPWVYVVCGLAALTASYLAHTALWSFLFGLPGFVSLLAGIVVLLRRRDYRRMRRQYDRPEALAEAAREVESP
ncbi:MAG TPA: hypothetical protein VLW26_11600 [Steroidobacteraceae bacterium]|nr:hypothetical protein [Steroidobacteraceae bacterium]